MIGVSGLIVDDQARRIAFLVKHVLCDIFFKQPFHAKKCGGVVN